MQAIMDRICYERSFTLSERWERAKEKGAIWIARRLPRRVVLWAIVNRHADVTRPDQHPDTVSAFDLYRAA